MDPILLVAHTHWRPRKTQDRNREVTKGPQDANPINRVTPINANIEARLERLEVGYERHENRLNEYNARLKEHESRLVKQDSILEKSNKILKSLKNTHCEHIRWTRATHGSPLQATSGGMVTMRQLTALKQKTWTNFTR